MSARDRIAPVTPDNMPPPARPTRRPPPDDTPAQPTPAPPPANGEPQLPATVRHDTGSRNLGSFLGGPDTQEPPDTGTGGGGGSISYLALAGRRKLDPDTDMVQLNTTIPWYYRRALELTCTAEQVRVREVVMHALDQVLAPQLLADCRAAAERDRQ